MLLYRNDRSECFAKVDPAFRRDRASADKLMLSSITEGAEARDRRGTGVAR
jgi:hypothetical protein